MKGRFCILETRDFDVWKERSAKKKKVQAPEWTPQRFSGHMAEASEEASSASSDESASGPEDGTQRNPKYASSGRSSSVASVTVRSPDYAAVASNEEKNSDFSHRADRATLPPHSRMDPDSKKRKSDGGLEYARRTNMLNIQSAMAAQDAFLRAGYDMRPYYGWLPGIAPLRFPALIYPQTAFFDFAPPSSDVDGRGEQGNDSNWNSNVDRSEKRDENKDDLRPNVVGGGHKGCEAKLNEKARRDSDTFQREAVVESDSDEGLELDEHDVKNVSERLMRRGSLGGQSGHSQTQSQTRVTSVIRENSTAQYQATENDVNNVEHDECDESDEDSKGSTKRGRASTRQIEKTEQYWDRRQKNNVSAKKSRDARRQREMITNQRSSMLETENLRLRAEVATLREENERLKKELSKVSPAV